MNEFVAIDVETANSDVASICQVGIARFCSGEVVEEWQTYVDPKSPFDPINVSIHGISRSTIAGAPIFLEASSKITEMLAGKIVVCHTHFDRASINGAYSKRKLDAPSCQWLDSARVARRTWEVCRWGGYGLRSVCGFIGYKFKHHEALEDAKASGQIMLAAIAHTGIDVAGWLTRVEQPIDLTKTRDRDRISRDGNPDGVLYGETIVFTGSLNMTRVEAAEMAARMGCEVDKGVNKKTSILVVGDQDIDRLNGKEKSNKHIKAEALAMAGQNIRILTETDFLSLVGISPH